MPFSTATKGYVKATVNCSNTLVKTCNRFNHTSWVAIVTLTDRPKSVRNRCVIEVFGGVFALSRCFLDFTLLPSPRVGPLMARR